MPLNKSWHEYNESLIERGRILMDIGYLRSSKREINGYRDAYGNGYLAASDFNRDKPYLGGIRVEELNMLIQQSEARRIAVILDCSFGLANEIDRPVIDTDDSNKEFKKQLEILSGKGKSILAASEEHQDSSRETPDTHYHGIFTSHLIQGLNGGAYEDGIITLKSLYRYLEKQMTGTKQKFDIG